MSRRFIAAVLAVSTSIATISALPARAATDEDIAALLAGVATVFILGKALEQAGVDTRHEGRKKADVVKRYDRPAPKVIPRHQTRHGALVLPAQCVRRIEGGSVRRVVMGRCLKRTGFQPASLPRTCRMRVQTQNGQTRAFALPCLRQRGYDLAY